MLKPRLTPERSTHFTSLWKRLFGEELSASEAAKQFAKLIGLYEQLLSSRVGSNPRAGSHISEECVAQPLRWRAGQCAHLRSISGEWVICSRRCFMFSKIYVGCGAGD